MRISLQTREWDTKHFVQISWHLGPSQRRSLQVHPIILYVRMFTPLSLLGNSPKSFSRTVVLQRIEVTREEMLCITYWSGIELNSRPTVSRPVRLGVRPPFGSHD
jgi:hypothetical protein